MAKRRMISGICRLCGENKELSFEHIPPRSAFNSRTSYREVTFDEWANVDNPFDYKPKGKVIQGGTGFHALCRDCNSFLGREYVTAYQRWANIFMEASLAQTEVIELSVLAIQPLRILKQIIAMLVCINDKWYLKEYPDLAEFLKNPDSNKLPDNYRLFLYIKGAGNFRFKSHSTVSDPAYGILNMTELAFAPFGYILTFDYRGPFPKMAEITSFKSFASDRNYNLTFSLKRLPTWLPMPLDYRSREEIERAMTLAKKNRQ